MSEMSQEHCFEHFLIWLKGYHAEVMAVEAKGLAFLQADDTPGYVTQMQEKAQMLSRMCDESKPHLEGLDGPWRAKLVSSLERFSNSANMALRLNSVFFMSALLYPDEHKAGEPDNLFLCIQRMEQEGQDFNG